MAAFVSSNMPNDLSSKINTLLGELTAVAREYLQSQNLNLLLMPMFKNHNYFVGIDTSTLHVVYTTEGVTSGIVSGNEKDLRSKGKLSQKQIVEACVRELGYKDIHYLAFPVSLLDRTPDERKPYLEQLVGQYVQERIRPLIMLDKIGLTESLRYLQNARTRFDTKTAEGYSDCKANCRNALISALKTLTGKEDIRDAVKELGKRGLLGKREQEFIESFSELLAKLYGLASKRGSHPPMTIEEDDAELVLSITTSILNYVTNRAIKQKG